MRITAPPLPRHPGGSKASSSASGRSARDLEPSGLGTVRHRNVRSLSPAPSPRNNAPTPTPTSTETSSTIPATTGAAIRRSGAPRRHNSAATPRLAAYMNRYQEEATTKTNREQDPVVKEELAALSGRTKENGAPLIKNTETNPMSSREEQTVIAPTKVFRRMKKKTVPTDMDPAPNTNEEKVAPSTTTSTVAPWMKKTKSQDHQVEKDFSKDEKVTTATTTTIGKKVTGVASMKKDSGVPAVTEHKEASIVGKMQDKVVAAPWITKENNDQQKQESILTAAGIQETVVPRVKRYQKPVGNEPPPIPLANLVAPVRRKEKKATWMERDDEKDPIANKVDDSPSAPSTLEKIVAPVRRKEKKATWMERDKKGDEKDPIANKVDDSPPAIILLENAVAPVRRKEKKAPWMQKTSEDEGNDLHDSPPAPTTLENAVAPVRRKEKKAPWMQKTSVDEGKDPIANNLHDSPPAPTTLENIVVPVRRKEKKAPWMQKTSEAEGKDPIANNLHDSPPAPTTLENIVAPVRRKEKKAPWMQENSVDEGQDPIANNFDDSPREAVAMKRQEKLAPWMTKNQVDPDANSNSNKNNNKADYDSAVNSSVPVKTGTVAALAKKQTVDVSKTSSTKTKKKTVLSPVFKKGTVASLTKKPSKKVEEKVTTVSTTVESLTVIKKGTVASLTGKQEIKDSAKAPNILTTVVSPMAIKKGTVASLTRKQRKEDAERPTSVAPPARKTIVAPWMKGQSTVEKPTRNSEVRRERRKMKKIDAARGVESTSVIEPSPASQPAQPFVAPADPALAPPSISKTAVAITAPYAALTQEPTHSDEQHGGEASPADAQQKEQEIPESLEPQNNLSITESVQREELEEHSIPDSSEKQRSAIDNPDEGNVATRPKDSMQTSLHEVNPSRQDETDVQEPIEWEEPEMAQVASEKESENLKDVNTQAPGNTQLREPQDADIEHDEQWMSSPIPDKSRSHSVFKPATNDEPATPSSSAHFQSTGLENSIRVLDLALGESFVVASATQDEEVEEDDDGEDDEDGHDDDEGGNSSSEGGNVSPRNYGLRDSAESNCSFDLSVGPCEEVSSIGEEEEIEVEILEYIIEDISVDGEEKIDLHLSKNVADLELRKMFSKANIGFDMDDMSELDETTEIPDETEVDVDDDARADSGSPVLGEKARNKGVSNDFLLASPSPRQDKGKFEIIGFVSPGRQRRGSTRSLRSRRTSDFSVQSEYSEYVLEESEVDLEYVDEEEILEEEEMAREEVLEEEVTEVECDEETEAEDGSTVQVAATCLS
jgi:hypothetical protein